MIKIFQLIAISLNSMDSLDTWVSLLIGFFVGLNKLTTSFLNYVGELEQILNYVVFCSQKFEFQCIIQYFILNYSMLPLREKCPNTEFLLARIFPHSD